jgi:N-carbamoylputrescine amidase
MERVVGLARDRAVVIIAGIMEVADRHGSYITQMIAGPEGLLGLYRKTHLSPQEKGGYLAGKKIETFSWKGVTFGVQLCYETHFPEISTVLVLKGAEVIFMPHASPRGLPREKFQSWLRHLPGRAFDNSVFVIACNQVGKTRAGFSFPGVVLALNPAGRPIAQYRGSKEKMVLFDLKGDELTEIREHRMRYFLPHRRPELYSAVIIKQ